MDYSRIGPSIWRESAMAAERRVGGRLNRQTTFGAVMLWGRLARRAGGRLAGPASAPTGVIGRNPAVGPVESRPGLVECLRLITRRDDGEDQADDVAEAAVAGHSSRT